MTRTTGVYNTIIVEGEEVRAFIPNPLPPKQPVLRIIEELAECYTEAVAAIGRLEVAGAMVPSPGWFLYGFVRKEAVVSSQIEGTQATLEDIVAFETTHQAQRPADVEEVCNYVSALAYGRAELENPKGLPLCVRLLCEIHKLLLTGVRGQDKQPGTIRRSQNWIGGTRPGNAHFVPPPPEKVLDALTELEKWIHSDDTLPALIKIGLAHVQFETIHPYLDGNGRVGRLLITLLIEHWGLLSTPILYLSLSFKLHREEYYRRLDAVRTKGDWENWTSFFLKCVYESANDAVQTAQRLFALVSKDRVRLSLNKGATLTAFRLFEFLPENPMITLAKAMELVSSTKPTTGKAIEALIQAKVLKEITGKKRDRVYAYSEYLDVLAENTEI